MDIRSSLAAMKYAATRPATTAMPTPGGQTADAFGGAMRDFATTLSQGEGMAKAALAGRAEPHALVQALAESQLAIETAVTVRDKVVEAYQEILRMPV